MHVTNASAYAAVVDATRPRRSGVAQNAYVVRSKKEPEPDYAKMKRALQGNATENANEEDAPAKP